MRLLNLAGRLALDVDAARAIDVEKASEGRFGPDAEGIGEMRHTFRVGALR